ncbi:P-loop NTPase family protein [Williamsia deligens]|uniref:Capsular polysaccharide biosynthesis protein n=1 Tax=Williamsia deligens TaxID=321325 RepID=A0ABW3G360_9NOCA|nr:hypothetical protein [Williamsia deligens]MCP2194175.1 Chromosome partitioning ATPase, Mrp family, contains Fe-S cluster [Williamsia deligens]
MTEVRDRILHRWWVVVAAVVVAVVVAVLMTTGRDTDYTSKAALTTYSANRAPEQDAVLIQSYVDFFDNGANQQALRAAARVPADVTFTAQPVATGPIMFIVATGPDASTVPAAAEAMANAFRDSINQGVQRTRQSAIDALQKPFAERQARGDQVLPQERVQLSQSIDELNSDTSGRLQDLTSASAATADRPAVAATVSVAVVVGLLLGAVIAWLIGGWAPRLRRPDQVREVMGVRTFDASGDGGSDRRLQMRHVVNALSFDDLPVPSVVAVVGVGGRTGSSFVAEELARIRSAQGVDVALVRTVRDGDFAGIGMVDVLRTTDGDTVDAHRLDDALHPADRLGASVTVLGAGGEESVDPYDVMNRQNVTELIGLLRKRFDVTVVECAPVDTAAEAQLLCSTADRTLIAVESGVLSPTRGRRAADLLRQSEIDPFAAVLVTGDSELTPSRLLSSSR